MIQQRLHRLGVPGTRKSPHQQGATKAVIWENVWPYVAARIAGANIVDVTSPIAPISRVHRVVVVQQQSHTLCMSVSPPPPSAMACSCCRCPSVARLCSGAASSMVSSRSHRLCAATSIQSRLSCPLELFGMIQHHHYCHDGPLLRLLNFLWGTRRRV